MNLNSKRGQAAGAAVLLAIIAGFLIMFVLFIPPAERAELLGDPVPGGSETSPPSTGVAEMVLLTQTPGRLDYLGQKDIEHPLPPTTVYTKTESKIIGEKPTVYAKKGLFSEDESDVSLFIPDLKNTNNVLLHFNIEKMDGRLIIFLNGDPFLEKDITAGNVAPIALPKGLLRSSNTITFAVSSPGIAFWQTNELVVENVKIIADVTSVSAQSSRSVFLISEDEKRNIKDVALRFQPHCNSADVGKLHISINTKEIFSALPDCELPMIPIAFAPTLLNVGENEVLVFTEKGSYELSPFLIKSNLKDLDYLTYYFEFSEEQFKAVEEGKRRVRVTLNFVDVVTSKRGEILFNGHRRSFDTKEVTYSIDLDNSVVRGNNALKIKPKQTLEIRELKIELLK